MIKYDDTVSSQTTGQPIYGAQVTVLNAQGLQATIYSDEAGTIPLSQPILTDQSGYFSFYIDDGRYNVVVMAGQAEIARTNITMVDTLGIKQRALLVPVNEDGATIAPADARKGMVLAFDAATGAPSAVLPNEFSGPTGPANSTYTTLASLKAAPQSNRSYILADGTNSPVTYAYVAGDFTGRADDVNVVKLDAVPLTTGALVRQSADSISYASSLLPAPRRPVNRVLDDIPTLPSLGVTPTNTPTANATKLAEIMAKANDLALGTATPPRIHVPAGIYPYETSPNFAVQGLHLDCEPGVVFKHTGGGVAFNVDGGASGGGVYCVRVTGGPVIRGNPNTTDGLYNRAVQHSVFDVEIQSVSAAGLRTQWAVCNEYTIRFNPLARPGFNPVATTGLFLSSRNPGEKTSACTFYNPIIGGINGYAININDGIANKIIGGTAETSVGGIYIGPDSIGNNLDGLDIEFCTSIDVFCQGLHNEIYVKVSDSNSTIGGLKNYVRGGLWNSITNNGEHNEFESINFGIAGGGFTDNGTFTVYRQIRNALGGAFLPDRVRQPQEGRYLTALNGIGYWEASADQITGGSVNDTYHYKYGGGKDVFGGPGGDRFGHSAAGIGFYDKAATPVAKQTVSGARGGSAALADLITKLAALGIITDGTTA